jgi:hypothetical protein
MPDAGGVRKLGTLMDGLRPVKRTFTPLFNGEWFYSLE